MTAEKTHKQMTLLVIVLLALNLLLGIYVGFFKKDAVRLETLKAGGAENMQMVKELYTSPLYIQQQKSALQQYLGSINQAFQEPTDTTSQQNALQVESDLDVNATE